MKAVILAAGTAKRLGALTQDVPKCLLRVGPCSIIEHQLGALEGRGVEPITVVTGHGAAPLRRLLGDRVRYVHNERYDETNSMYSMWLARDAAADGFLLLNSDVLFHPALLDRLLDSSYPDALLVDFREDLSDPELMRVRVTGDRLMEISKEIPPAQAHGENVGVVKFGAEGARRLFAKADELVAAGVERRWAPYVYNAIAAEHVLRTVPTDGLAWIEIDFVEDLERAGREVLPHLGFPVAR
jgi:choline kinase